MEKTSDFGGFSPDFIRYSVELKREQANAKKDYWISCGSVLFEGDEALKQKWTAFVVENINGAYTGIGIDELLQVMSMIKMQVPSNIVCEVIQQMPEKEFVMYNIGQFVHPEFIPTSGSMGLR